MMNCHSHVKWPEGKGFLSKNNCHLRKVRIWSKHWFFHREFLTSTPSHGFHGSISKETKLGSNWKSHPSREWSIMVQWLAYQIYGCMDWVWMRSDSLCSSCPCWGILWYEFKCNSPENLRWQHTQTTLNYDQLWPSLGDYQLQQDGHKRVCFKILKPIMLYISHYSHGWCSKCQFMAYPQNVNAQYHDGQNMLGYGHPSLNSNSSLRWKYQKIIQIHG